MWSIWSASCPTPPARVAGSKVSAGKALHPVGEAGKRSLARDRGVPGIPQSRARTGRPPRSCMYPKSDTETDYAQAQARPFTGRRLAVLPDVTDGPRAGVAHQCL